MSSKYEFDLIIRSITIDDLKGILNDLSCSNRARIAPHLVCGTIELSFRCYVYYDQARAFVKFTNDDRRTFIKLARAGLAQQNCPIRIIYLSSLLTHPS